MAKMTEQEIRGLCGGKFVGIRCVGWQDKLTLYKNADVHGFYVKLKASYKVLLVDWDGEYQKSFADKIAQLQIDTFLIRRARGEDVSLPELYSGPLKKDAKKEPKKTPMTLFDISDFSEDAKNAPSDPVGEIEWIYANLRIKDVDPKKAPSVGAYGFLMWAQENPINRADFLKTTYSKIIPSKSQIDKGDLKNDDGRPTLKLIERLHREVSADSGELPNI